MEETKKTTKFKNYSFLSKQFKHNESIAIADLFNLTNSPSEIKSFYYKNWRHGN